MKSKSTYTSALSYALKYTFILSLFYAIYLFLDRYAPQGKEFFSYAAAKVFADIIVFAFPLLWILFYVRNNDTFSEDTLHHFFPKKSDDDLNRDNKDVLQDKCKDEKHLANLPEEHVDYVVPQNISDEKEIRKQKLLREYHVMLQEGILTQEEFNTIKKRHLKEMDAKNKVP